MSSCTFGLLIYDVRAQTIFCFIPMFTIVIMVMEHFAPLGYIACIITNYVGCETSDVFDKNSYKAIYNIFYKLENKLKKF